MAGIITGDGDEWMDSGMDGIHPTPCHFPCGKTRKANTYRA